jgi:mono/diheme cytochrome c family protein
MEVPMTRGIAVAALAAVTVLTLAVSPTTGQDQATRMGRATAELVCAECHAVRRGETKSPHSGAPAFPAIAAVSGMTATALHVALQTSHRNMPNIVLQPDEREDVVAYILSLKP